MTRVNRVLASGIIIVIMLVWWQHAVQRVPLTEEMASEQWHPPTECCPSEFPAEAGEGRVEVGGRQSKSRALLRTVDRAGGIVGLVRLSVCVEYKREPQYVITNADGTAELDWALISDETSVLVIAAADPLWASEPVRLLRASRIHAIDIVVRSLSAEVVGQCVDSRTGDPVAGVRISTLSGPLAESDGRGRFSVRVLGDSGSVALRFVHPDYAGRELAVSPQGPVAAIRIVELRPLGQLQIEVVDDRGGAISHACIIEYDDKTRLERRRTSTNDLGRATLRYDQERGLLQTLVRVKHGKFATWYGYVPAGCSPVATIAMQASQVVHGRVWVDINRPAAFGGVRWSRDEECDPCDAVGAFSLSSPANVVGEVLVAVSGERVRGFVVTEDGDHSVGDLLLGPCRDLLIHVGSGGDPVPGARIDLVQQLGDGQFVVLTELQGHSNAEGDFVCRGVPACDIEVCVRHDGYLKRQGIRVAAQDRECRVELDGAGVLSGSIVVDRGLLPSLLYVRFWPVGAVRVRAQDSLDGKELAIGADGVWRLSSDHLIPGENYTVAVAADGFDECVRDVRCEPPATLKNATTFLLNRCAECELWVVDSQSNDPIEGAEIWITRSGLDGMPDPQVARLAGVVDRAGRFLGKFSGGWCLTARAPGYVETLVKPWIANKLEKGLQVSGVCCDVDGNLLRGGRVVIAACEGSASWECRSNAEGGFMFAGVEPCELMVAYYQDGALSPFLGFRVHVTRVGGGVFADPRQWMIGDSSLHIGGNSVRRVVVSRVLAGGHNSPEWSFMAKECGGDVVVRVRPGSYRVEAYDGRGRRLGARDVNVDAHAVVQFN